MIIGFGIILALIILGIVLWMLLTRRLREKYAVLWILIGVAVLVLGLFPQLLVGLSHVLHVAVPANLLFALATLLLVGVSLHLSWELSQVEDETRRLAEEVAILRAQHDTLAHRLRAISLPASDTPAVGQDSVADDHVHPAGGGPPPTETDRSDE